MLETTRTVLRTVVQVAVGLAAGLPLLLAASGAGETTGAVGVVLAAAAVVTRVMHSAGAVPVLRWLGLAAPAPAADPAPAPAVPPTTGGA